MWHDKDSETKADAAASAGFEVGGQAGSYWFYCQEGHGQVGAAHEEGHGQVGAAHEEGHGQVGAAHEEGHGQVGAAHEEGHGQVGAAHEEVHHSSGEEALMSVDATTPAAAKPTSLAADRELIRSAAKWFIGGLGVIGGVLVAGSQISDLGALDPASVRFWIAVFGVTCGLGAVMFAMWGVVDILASRQWTWDAVVLASGSASDGGVIKSWIESNPSILGGYESVESINAFYVGADPEDAELPALTALMTEITDKVASADLDHRWLNLRRRIAAGVSVGALGLLLFAWAANPGTPSTSSSPSLRFSDLRGADLSGVSLPGVDLTGADLRGANLRNGVFTDAVVRQVVWGNTTCPDGTNSDYRGTSAVPTCEGHLIP